MISSMYIHIPFCKTICSYCDFCKMFYSEKNVLSYLDSLEKEIGTYYRNEKLKTLYIGGGTPSSLSRDAMDKLFSIISFISLENDYEFTFECNIEQINEELLRYLYEHGVNRLSIGVQTCNEKFLSFLNRNHDCDVVKEKIGLAKKIGFSNINVDLMYAFPGQTMEDLKKDLEFFVSLDVQHISTYSLIIEPHTKIYIDGVEPISDELDASMYEMICSFLEKYGYKHYEVSNFSKEGFSSRHNLTYWDNGFYYGFGLGASGYVPYIRYENTRSLNQYLKGNYRLEEHNLSLMEQLENEFILGFRKVEGVSKSKILDKYGLDVLSIPVVKKLLGEGKLEEKGNNLYIPMSYFYLSNVILMEFIDMEVCL